MSDMRKWKRLGHGWWWINWSCEAAGWFTGLHADLTLTIWPAWRFSVCRWDGPTPRHDYIKGWRFGRARAMRAAESALRVADAAAPRGGET